VRKNYSFTCIYLCKLIQTNKLLSKQGLSALHMNTAFYALIMSQILYAVSSFYNHLTGSLVERIDTFFRRMSRYGYTNNFFVLRDIVNDIDATLFKKIVRPTHCHHHLLPPAKPHLGLRPKEHPYILPTKSNLFRHSFVSRCLFKLVSFYFILFYIVLLAIFTRTCKLAALVCLIAANM
jgi:hypothetical protein